MSPKESLKKISLIQFLDQFAYKEEVQDILNSFDLPVSGTKDELLQRLKKPLGSEEPEKILNILSKNSLKNSCDYFGLPVGGTKDALIERILNDIITVKSPAVEKSANISEKNVEKPTKNGPKKDHLYEILNGLSKSDIERGLKDEGLSTSGSKEEMIVRLLAATKNDPKRTLMSLDGQKLNAYAEENDIPRRRSKEDQVNEILKMEFGIDTASLPLTEIISPIEPQPVKISPQFAKPLYYEENKNSLSLKDKFVQVSDYIDKWIPSESWPEEGGYRADLYHYLRNKYTKVRSEKGETRIDILVDDQIPIEVKLAPDQKEYQRAFEQAYRHMEQYNLLIEVICRPKVQSLVREYEERVQRMARPQNYLFKLIIK
jgi:hypothetical protein